MATGTIIGILATAALSHLGGHLAGGVLARFGLMGFGSTAIKALKYRRMLKKALRTTPAEELNRWGKEAEQKK